MKVVLVTAHAADAERKTGFHFWAEILSRKGVDVDWLTVGYSRITGLKKNARTFSRPYNKWVRLNDHFRKFVWHAPFHPVDFGGKFLNYLSGPLFALYPALLPGSVRREVRDADLFIVEIGAGVMLVPLLARLCPNAKFIYNVSDRPQVIHFHPVVLHAQKTALPYFKKIRVNAAAIGDDFPPGAPVIYIPQAIDKLVFDRDMQNPYDKPRNAISIGDMLFDAKAVEILATQFPDWTFHLFGKGARLDGKQPNVIEYGETPFEKIVPYLRHADIGLAPYRAVPDADYLSQSSLKMVQYTYCRLPIVGPDFAAVGRTHVLSYAPGALDTGAPAAFRKAMNFDRKTIDQSVVLGWDEHTQKMLDLYAEPAQKKG